MLVNDCYWWKVKLYFSDGYEEGDNAVVEDEVVEILIDLFG